MKLCVAVIAYAAIFMLLPVSPGQACEDLTCPSTPEVGFEPGTLTASLMTGAPGDHFRSASNSGASEHTYTLVTPCEFSDPRLGGCAPGNFTCPEPADRVVIYYLVLSQRVAQTDRRVVDGLAPDSAIPVGTTYGPVANEGPSCVDVTDLNPPPSPAEVYRYFRTLPLPELTMQQQPPGNGLVGLPVIFYTDSPTTQTFTVDIRGFQVFIRAGAVSYTWHTGDGTDLTSDNPGAPYPNQTVTHDYSSGTYTAYLTTTWGATFTVNGGAAADVPGTTTTDGPPVTFAVLQARPVLTNPFD
jgi:hypothetical protein